MRFRPRFNLRTAFAASLLASLAAYYAVANPDAIHGAKLVHVIVEAAFPHRPRMTPVEITESTAPKEVVSNRTRRVNRLIHDVRQSGLYDRPLPAVLAEMGFDPDDTDSFFLS